MIDKLSSQGLMRAEQNSQQLAAADKPVAAGICRPSKTVSS
jgi:hypothetical protein